MTDPRRDTVLVHVRFTSLDGQPYRVFALYDPSLANDGMDDQGRSRGSTLVAEDGDEPVASALAARPALGKASSGYLGTSDGWTDLAQDHRMDWEYARAGRGNVVQTARLSGVTGLGAAEVPPSRSGSGRTPPPPGPSRTPAWLRRSAPSPAGTHPDGTTTSTR